MDAAASSSSWKGMMEQGNEPHVLAVDDNIIDRKLVEKLLKNSSCKGTQLLSLHSNHSLMQAQENFFAENLHRNMVVAQWHTSYAVFVINGSLNHMYSRTERYSHSSVFTHTCISTHNENIFASIYCYLSVPFVRQTRLCVCTLPCHLIVFGGRKNSW